jgi:amidase
MDELAFASATRLAADVRDRRVGCLELLDHFLARAERHNPALNAIVAWQIDGARDRARAAMPHWREARSGARCTACR